jgi:hypothetical protein
MPNPSTIAMQEEAVSEQKLFAAPEEIPANEVEIEVVSVPDGTSPEVIEELDYQANRANSYEALALEYMVENAELRNVRDDLTGALSHLGKDRIELLENLEGLQAVARAADRYVKATTAFEEVETASDAQTQEAAEAACELELLVEKYGPLYRR